MLEAKIEQSVCDYARDRDVLVYKFTSPNRAAVPDRLFVFPNGTMLFIEFKRTGAKPTIPQEREHLRLVERFVPVYVIDDIMCGRDLIVHFQRHDASIVPTREHWL